MKELKIICCVKQTFATDAAIQLKDDGGIVDEKVSLIVNPYDEYAVEEALQIREASGGEVTIVTVGTSKADETIRQCLAMGADKAVRIDCEGLDGADEWVYAHLLAEAIRTMDFDLILCGKVAVDSNAAEVPVRLAELLGLPQINVISKLDFEDGLAVGRREGDGASEIIAAPLPAVVTTEKGLNEPRYPTLPNIMKAKRKPLDVVSWQDLGFSGADDQRLRPMVSVVSRTLPPGREAAKMISGNPEEAAKELVRILHEDVGVI